MHVRFMQRVDYWMGIPLCALVSLYDRVRRLVNRSGSAALGPAAPGVKRLLFIELSEMGSAIIAYAALREACDRFGPDNVHFLIFARNRESVELLNLLPAANIFVIDDHSFSAFALSMAKTLLKIRASRIDTAIDMELFSRCTALVSYLSGARTRIGFDNYSEEGLYRGRLSTHPVWYNGQQHINANFMALLRAIDVDPNDRPLVKVRTVPQGPLTPTFNPQSAELATMENMLTTAGCRDDWSELIVINPDPGLLTLRGWPVESFRELVQRLLRERADAVIAVIGLARSRSFADALRPAEHAERFLDLTGKTDSLRAVLVLLKRAALLITNDSGPAHLAPLVDAPTLVLFGPESPQRYGPLGNKVVSLFAGLACSPCYSAANHRHSICRNNRCMQAISVDEALRAARRLLDPPSSRSFTDHAAS